MTDPSFTGKLEALQRTLDRCMENALMGATTIDLVFFPHRADIDDSLAWLGTVACMNRLDIPIGRQLSMDGAKRVAGDDLGEATPILLDGRSAIGDGQPSDLANRIDLLTRIRHRPVIQMPASVTFSSKDEADRYADACKEHGNLTILAPDTATREFYENRCGIEAIPCPPTGLGLGLIEAPGTADRPLIIVSNHATPENTTTSLSSCWIDWTIVGVGEFEFMTRSNDLASKTISLEGKLIRMSEAAVADFQTLNQAYTALAYMRVQRAMTILSRAQSVATDQLSGHILCLCMELPHAIFASQNESLSQIHECWTQWDSHPFLFEDVFHATSSLRERLGQE